MHFHKIMALSLLFIALPTLTFWHVGVGASINIPLTKQDLLIGAAIGGTAVAAYYLTSYLYHYFFVMTLPKAERLCHDVSGYIEKTTAQYHREFALLEKGIAEDTLKAELQNIITESESGSPYLTYTKSLQDSVQSAQSFEERFSKGIPQLESAMDKVVQTLGRGQLLALERENLAGELQRYKAVFTSIAGLRELVHALRFKMQKLVRLCLQFDAYRQEKILEKLQAIETQLIVNSMQPKTTVYYRA